MHVVYGSVINTGRAVNVEVQSVNNESYTSTTKHLQIRNVNK